MKLRNLISFGCAILLALEFAIIIYQRCTINQLRGNLVTTVRTVLPPNPEAAVTNTSSTDNSPVTNSNDLTQDFSQSLLIKRFRSALQDPDFLRKLSIVQKQWIADHYDKLFQSMNLDSAEKEKFIKLLAEKQIAKADAAGAMQDVGLSPGESPLSVIADAQKDINSQIEQLLGREKYNAYYHFEMTDGLRTTLGRLQESLAYTSEPISDAVVESMVEILDKATPPNRRGGMAQFTGASPLVASGLGAPPFSSLLPADAPKLLASQLSPSQLSQLQALMGQQRDELKFRAASIAANRAAKSSGE